MDLSIVIVSWNVRDLLTRCLQSIENYSGTLRYEVIVIDNASADGSTAMVREHFPRVRVIALESNIGFARANNRALGAASGRYVFFLNPDTEVAAGCFENLVNFMDAHPSCALAAPQIVNPDGTFQRGSIRRDPTLASQLLILLKMQHVLRTGTVLKRYYADDFDHARSQQVQQPMGAALCVRRSVLDRVGFFDEHFFLWFEEVDLCKRIRAAGGEIWYHPDSRVIHHGGKSFAQTQVLKKQHIFNRSLIHYFVKHHGIVATLPLLCVIPLNMFAVSLYQIARPYGRG